MGRLLLPGGPQRAEHERERRGQLILGGKGAAELLGQCRDDLAGALRRDVLDGLVILDGDQEIGVQITSGAQAVVAVVGVVPVQRAVRVDAAGAMLVPIGGGAVCGREPPPVVYVGDDIAVAPVLVDGQREDGDGAGAVVLQAVVGRQVELSGEEGVRALDGVDQVVEVGAVHPLFAAGDGEVVAVVLVEGLVWDQVEAQAESPAGCLVLQRDPRLASIGEDGAAGGVLECDLFHVVAPFVLLGRAFWLACMFGKVSPARSRLSQCGQM
ncbi:hypothetical protein 2209_scaffold441_00044 [Bacteriophage sp.]|nr:hypothetical protein 2209_scaffold441_00044 [Bacteriophage sp.]